MHHHAPPRLSDTLHPPLVLGTAALTHAAMAGAAPDRLAGMIAESAVDPAARDYDVAMALQLVFRRAEAMDLLDGALAANPLYRVRGTDAKTVRLLALLTPGDLMMNTPLDFITNHLGVRLDLLYLLPGQDLPDPIPDHDVAIVASSEPDLAELERLNALFAAWPRPILNDPSLLRRLGRAALPKLLAGRPGLCSPGCRILPRETLAAMLRAGAAPAGLFPGHAGPVLIRPAESHAGVGLEKIADAAELAAYLDASSAPHFAVTEFVDYRGPDGLYRKYRIAFIDREPYLCHMASSRHWMVHYLNAGMIENADRRAAEAEAMASFRDGFARRHAAAFAALHAVLAFDFYSIDCGETADGRLLLFEADTAAIIHLMDPPDLFPYKQAPMRQAFAAFDAMLRRRAGLTPAQ